jgi:hypothetical protein
MVFSPFANTVAMMGAFEIIQVFRFCGPPFLAVLFAGFPAFRGFAAIELCGVVTGIWIE